MDFLSYLLPLLGVIIGFVLCYNFLFSKRKEQLEHLAQENIKLSKEVNTLKTKSSESIKQKEILQQKVLNIEANTKLRLEDKDHGYAAQITQLKSSYEAQIEELKLHHTRSQESHKILFQGQAKEQRNVFERRLKDQEEQFNRLHAELKGQFQNLASEIMEEKAKKMDEYAERNLNELLNPLKEKLTQFESQIKESYDKEARERFSMQKELQSLLNMNQQLSIDAQSLTQALKGDSKTQGDWGEMVLERILEQSGLHEGREYFKQMSIKDENNKNLRPDFVIQYPGNRFLVIDSKVSLRDYEQYRQATNEEEKERFVKRHIDAIKVHISQLSDKKYDDYVPGSSLDFVLMFLPVEGAFMTAMQHDKELWNHAFDKRILLISPTNLIAAMRMITTLWKHDAQNKNVMAIAEESGKLYDKFVGFVEDMDKLNGQLDKTRDTFDEAYKKLSSGRGNLVSKTENLRKLGAKAKKSLPQDYIQLSQHDNHEE